MIDWDKVKHFKPEEWRKDPSKIDPLLVYTMDEVREKTREIKPQGIPIKIHVAWDDGGHSAKSYHYTGMAVDFHFVCSKEEFSFLEQFALLSCFDEFGGIGFYPEWKPVPGWHVDLRIRSARLLWYRQNGRYVYGFSSFIQKVAET